MNPAEREALLLVIGFVAGLERRAAGLHGQESDLAKRLEGLADRIQAEALAAPGETAP